MKTTEDLFHKMPEPFASMAIKNCTKCVLKSKESSASNDLARAFSWSRTEEENEFWYGAYTELIYIKK